MNLMNPAVSLGQGRSRLLSTSACAAWLPRLAAFENACFGSDFAWSMEQNYRWAASGRAFQAAIISGSPENKISASMSVLLTSRESCQRLIAGEITESELLPWNPGRRYDYPCLYFATVISSVTEELPLLYSSLGTDVGEYLDAAGLKVTLGIAISSGVAGKQHLERNGFRALNAKYLDNYEFLCITAQQARTPFWRRVLTNAAGSVEALVHESLHSVPAVYHP
jgi:hypothetical protein